MKNKNGILMPETLKIIIAVVCVFLLGYLIFGFYGMFAKSSALKQAEVNIEKINDAIKKIDNGEGSQEIFLESPKDWWLTAWPYKNKKPVKCLENYCVCICPIPGLDATKEESSEVCDEKGVCKDFSIPIDVDETFLWLWKKPLTMDGLVNLKLSLNKDKEIVIEEIKK